MMNTVLLAGSIPSSSLCLQLCSFSGFKSLDDGARVLAFFVELGPEPDALALAVEYEQAGGWRDGNSVYACECGFVVDRTAVCTGTDGTTRVLGRVHWVR